MDQGALDLRSANKQAFHFERKSGHPAFAASVQRIAELYDLQHEPGNSDDLLYVSPATGEPVGTAFMVPHSYDDLLKRDKVNVDIFWLKDESLEDSASLPDPDVLAEEIAEDLRSALDQIEAILSDVSRFEYPA